MNRMPIEELVKVKKPEDDKKVLVTDGKGMAAMSSSCKVSI